ncbi:hypothetical protein KR009_004934, partial [Drosophila setifemur]
MSSELNDLRRLLHWGPITVLSLTFVVTWTTVEMNSMWWPPGESSAAMANYLLIWLHTFSTIFNFMSALMEGPGLVPKKWHPKSLEDCKYLQFCKICQGYKAPRSHHCRRCDRCVIKMDHHCPWINNCVGWGNQASFLYFLFYFLLGAVHACCIIGCAFVKGISRRQLIQQGLPGRVTLTIHTAIACLFAFGLAVGVGLACIKLLYIEGKVVFQNRTEIESWIIRKANFRRDEDPQNRIEPFVYPYDLGWRGNFMEVFSPIGDGIIWPVRPGCDQYTLTCEQLAQKKDKLARTRTYRCIRHVTGYWLPIISQGFLVTLHIPWADDPRIVLQPGDLIQVTRLLDYWLYGERVVTKEEKMGGRRPGAIRGWFPRCCAKFVAAEEEVRVDQAGGEPVQEEE